MKKKDKLDLFQFASCDKFIEWYRKQDKHCYICELTEHEQQTIVLNGILTSMRFVNPNESGSGKTRGMWLEVDKKDPKGAYSEDNCALCCYFCNNDKSDVFTKEQYKKFTDCGKTRVSYLRKILAKATKI